MTISLKELLGYRIQATDGELGKITDVYFDDKKWTVRYFVVELGTWFKRGKVILSPLSVIGVDSAIRRIDVGLSRQQVQNSPDVDTEQTVTVQMEAETLNYYRWPLYWANVGIFGTTAGFSNNTKSKTVEPSQPVTHLRSTCEVIGYFIQSPDKKFGKVEDILVKKSNWAIESFVAKTRRWLPSKSVLLNSDSMRSISWQNGEFLISLLSSQVRQLPGYSAKNMPSSRIS